MGEIGVLSIVYVLALLTLVGVCSFGVFHPAYDDTLLQRCAMSIVVFGGVAEINAVVLYGTSRAEAATTITCGAALFAVATLLKRTPRLQRRSRSC